MYRVLGCNPSFGLATKAKRVAKVRAKRKPGVTSYTLGSVRKCEGVNPHTPKWTPMLGVGVPKGLPNFQSAIAGAKTPCLEEFFISLERSWSVDVQNGLVWTIWMSAAQVMGKWKARSQIAILKEKDSRPLKVGNRPDLLGFRRRATYRWKALNEGYNFSSDLIAIEGLHKKLCASKLRKSPLAGFRDSHAGVPRQKAIWVWPPWRVTEYTIRGKVVASPKSGSWWVLCVRVARGSS
jgi:hypothetical protein